jgi:hypothetical protein
MWSPWWQGERVANPAEAWSADRWAWPLILNPGGPAERCSWEPWPGSAVRAVWADAGAVAIRVSGEGGVGHVALPTFLATAHITTAGTVVAPAHGAGVLAVLLPAVPPRPEPSSHRRRPRWPAARRCRQLPTTRGIGCHAPAAARRDGAGRWLALRACCNTLCPPPPRAGTSWASVPAHENGGADAGAPVPPLRIVSRPRGPLHQARQRRSMQFSRHFGFRSSHRRRQRRRHRRMPSASTWAEPASVRPRTPSEPTPSAASPCSTPRRGAGVASRFVRPSNLRASMWNLPHGLSMMPADLAGGERWSTASERPDQPRPPVTGNEDGTTSE